MNILIYPKKSSNDYIKVTESTLSENHRVGKFTIKNIFLYCKGNRLVILNWIENQVRQRGLLGYLLLTLLIRVLKVLGYKLVWVKHNKFPHDVNGRFRSYLTKKALNFLEVKSDVIVCHGKKYCEQNNYHFIPHPMYPVFPADEKDLDVNEFGNFKESFLIFGRMERYKKIEVILNKLKDADFNILIVGKFKDADYLHELLAIVNKNNLSVRIVNKFLSTKELDTLIKYSKGVIVSNDGDTSLVSGVFFHALALTDNLIVTQKGIVAQSGLDVSYSYFLDTSIKTHKSDCSYNPDIYTENFKNSWNQLLKGL